MERCLGEFPSMQSCIPHRLELCISLKRRADENQRRGNTAEEFQRRKTVYLP